MIREAAARLREFRPRTAETTKKRKKKRKEALGLFRHDALRGTEFSSGRN